MRFRDDDRGASVQIGVILLFGILVVSMAMWQANVVPADNAQVEFQHNQRAQDDVHAVRNAIVSAPSRQSSPSVTIDMAPEYPPRTLFVNPGPPSATLRTVGTRNESANLTVANASAADGEVGDYWDGSSRSYNTGAIAYEPGYNEYTRAPTTVYEHSVVYNHHRDGSRIVTSGQDVVDGRTITLVTVNGSLSRSTSERYSLDVAQLSASSNTVAIEDESGPVTISLVSRLDAAQWRDLLNETDEYDPDGSDPDAYVRAVHADPLTVSGTRFYRISIVLEAGETYELQMAGVGVGSGYERPSAEYVVDERGDGESIGVGDRVTLVAEVRDDHNNPVSGVDVTVDESQVDGGTIVFADNRTGADGRVTVVYEGTSSGTDVVNVSFGGGGPAPRHVEFTVVVTGGSGSGSDAFATSWDVSTIESQAGVTCGGPDSCTLDTSVTDTIDLEAFTTPTARSAGVEYAVSNATVGTVSPTSGETGADGRHSTQFTASTDGTVQVFTWSGGSGDALDLSVTNASDGGDAGPPTVTDASISNAPINDSDAGDAQTVTVTFNESMDTGVDPTVEITGLASSPYAASGSWVDATTWEGTVTIADDDEEATATIEVSGARDDDGNTMSPDPDTSNTFQVDTLAPAISNFQATNPDGTTINVSFDSSQSLSEIAVEVRDGGGSTVDTLTEADFAEAGGTYWATTDVGGAGGYTAHLLVAEDAAGNDGSSGENDSVTVTAADTVSFVSGSQTTDAEGTGSLAFQLNNSGDGAVTVQQVSAAVTSANNIDRILEQNAGTGCVPCNEMVFDGASDTGHYEAGDAGPGDAYLEGTTVSLTDPATIDASSDATVTMTYFGGGNNNNFNPRSVAGETVEVTVTFGDGSTDTYTFTA